MGTRAKCADLFPECLGWKYSTLWITILKQRVISTNLTSASFGYLLYIQCELSLALGAYLPIWAQLKTSAHIWNQQDEIQDGAAKKPHACAHLDEIKLKNKTSFFGGIRYDVHVYISQLWRLVSYGFGNWDIEILVLFVLYTQL